MAYLFNLFGRICLFDVPSFSLLTRNILLFAGSKSGPELCVFHQRVLFLFEVRLFGVVLTGNQTAHFGLPRFFEPHPQDKNQRACLEARLQEHRPDLPGAMGQDMSRTRVGVLGASEPTIRFLRSFFFFLRFLVGVVFV